MKTWETSEGSFESREASPEERIEIWWEHGIIDADVLAALGVDRRFRPGTKPEAHAVQALALAGWPIVYIEDAFGLSEDRAEELIAPVLKSAIRLNYLAGVRTDEIRERLEVSLEQIARATVDLSRRSRGPNRKPRKDKGVPRVDVDEIRRRLLAGQCHGQIAHELGVSKTIAFKHTQGIERPPHPRCSYCRPGPKPRARA